MRKKSDYLKQFIGEPIAFECVRFWYRGILAEVGEDFAILSQARAVESPGVSTSSVPQTEEVIPSDVMVALDSVEIACRPAWVFHEMEKPENVKGGAK